jgi:UDP-2,3-diacylglucosamine pyrophosphatase LpxH
LKSRRIVLKTRGQDDVQHEPGMRRYRALFISDLHLGTKACQAEAFLDFLRCHDASHIYLIGDIVDFWRIKRGIYWPQSHNDVLQKLLRKARKGTDLMLIPGNHDEALRDYCGVRFGGIAIERNTIHVGADGRRYLVMHGDEFDVVVRYAKWLALLGDWSYELALWANTHFNVLRRWFGMPYWSLSAYLKHKVKRAVNYIGEFEMALSQEARRHGAQGVICGHIHHAAMRQVGDVIYINTGDWVESCTAVAETEEGIFEIIRWTHPPEGMSTPEPLVEELEAAA